MTEPSMESLARRLRCPICNAEFVVELPLGLAPVRVETDFRPVFLRRDPIAAELHSCPACRYSGYAKAFEGDDEDEEYEPERRGLPLPHEPFGLPEEEDLDDLRRWIRRGTLADELGLKERDPTAAERYLLAARCREYLGDENHLALGDLYLRGAWCARAAEDAALEQRLLHEAAVHLAAALEGTIPEGEKGRLTYLTAEVARRAGDFARAVDLFGQVDAAVDADDEEGARLLRLTRRQEALAVVKSAVNATLPEETDEDGVLLPPPGGRPGEEDGDES